jgi:hypothetical protein
MTETRPYRPANGAEGDIFEINFCHKCKRFENNKNEPCHIFYSALIHDVDDPEYPKEWVMEEIYSERCTAFEPIEKE